MKRYFDVHVFFSRKNGYSVPVEIETDEDVLTEEDVIAHCVKTDVLGSDDADMVDSVAEIDLNEFNLMKGV